MQYHEWDRVDTSHGRQLSVNGIAAADSAAAALADAVEKRANDAGEGSHANEATEPIKKKGIKPSEIRELEWVACVVQGERGDECGARERWLVALVVWMSGCGLTCAASLRPPVRPSLPSAAIPTSAVRPAQ